MHNSNMTTCMRKGFLGGPAATSTPRPTVRTAPRSRLLIETDQRLISVLLSEIDQQLVIQLALRLARTPATGTLMPTRHD